MLELLPMAACHVPRPWAVCRLAGAAGGGQSSSPSRHAAGVRARSTTDATVILPYSPLKWIRRSGMFTIHTLVFRQGLSYLLGNHERKQRRNGVSNLVKLVQLASVKLKPVGKAL